MFGPNAAYVVATFALVFATCVALTWITTVRHLDPPECRELPEDASRKLAA